MAGVNRNILYRNEGNGSFRDVTKAVGIDNPHWAIAGIWLDYDNDSYLDLTDLCGEEFGGEIWNAFTPHYTPVHGSWLNQAEIEIGLFSRQYLGKRRIPDLKTLRREATAWNGGVNRDRVKIDWRFDRQAARQKFGYKKPSIRWSEN